MSLARSVAGLMLSAVVGLSSAGAHDLITDGVAQDALRRADADLKIVRSDASARTRAGAYYDLGRLVDELREVLNRDLDAHGEVRGLASLQLVSRLQAMGVKLVVDRGSGRFGSGDAYYAQAVRLARDVHDGDAAFRLLQGRFYDSLRPDPLDTRLPWRELEQQVTLAAWLLRSPQPAEAREETAFIAIVQGLQAARAAPDVKRARAFAEEARRAGQAFVERYPDSMRRATVEALLGSR
ncbi:MAG: hypothetical protein GC151_04265 [Betaproteobacteria bacterium]|nr:hypothetical protein [Betaproteobacteria bacterium]